MSPEEVARYDGYWNNVADDMLKSNLGDYRRAVLSGDITKTTGGKINSKVITVLFITLPASNYPKILQIKRRYSINYSDVLSVRLFYPVPSVIIATSQ